MSGEGLCRRVASPPHKQVRDFKNLNPRAASTTRSAAHPTQAVAMAIGIFSSLKSSKKRRIPGLNVSLPVRKSPVIRSTYNLVFCSYNLFLVSLYSSSGKRSHEKTSRILFPPIVCKRSTYSCLLHFLESPSSLKRAL